MDYKDFWFFVAELWPFVLLLIILFAYAVDELLES